MAIISDDNKIRVTGKAKPGQRVIRISNGSDIVYMPIGIAGTGGGSMSFYQCASYDDGETIPAYTNIVISGLTAPADANGTYVLQNITAEGTDRKWVNDNNYIIECKNYTWYIYAGTASPNAMTALYYSEVLPATTEDGTAENPEYWDSVIDGTDRTITPTFSPGDYSGSGYKRNFYVKLLAGTPYQIGVTNDGFDADVLLYDLTDTQLSHGDEYSAEINGISCNDSISYTPSVTGIYRIAAGAFSSRTGNAQVVCYPAPEVAEAPTATEPWEIEWTLGGAEEGAYIITNAGLATAIGAYTPSSETFDGNTVWTNTTTGAVWKASFSGSSWRWFWYPDATSTSYKYYENNYGSYATPWDVTTTWAYSGSTSKPTPTFARSAGYNATGTLTVGKTDIAERPATGVKVWTGYKATQDTETLKWTVADTLTNGLSVKGYTPIVGRIYSADTTVQVAGLTEDVPGQMICLVHFDGFTHNTAPAFVDGTQTCIISVQNQSFIVNDKAKFGDGSFNVNYRNVPSEGCFHVIGLPAVSGDFTVEFWHYYSGYADHGGLILYVYQTGDYETQMIAELNAVQLSESHPQYIVNAWYHHAFVRQGSTVSEYINGIKVAESEFTATLGGEYGLAVTVGGWGVYDVKNNIDEFAMFNYAKYTKNFTPPFIPYDDEPSGLRTPDTAVGEVSVSGITSIPFANSKSYTLSNPDYNTEYPYTRIWKTANGEWYIYFDDRDGCWAIANTTSWDDANHVEAAYLSSNSDDQWNIEPIGNSGWIDSTTKAKVKVKVNS